MTEQAAFLHAICTDPGEDTHRLVYADWLDEHGDSERAEFIRVGCEIAGVPLPPELDILRDGNKEESLREMTVWRKQWGKRYYSLRTRSAELLKAHELDWRGGGKCGKCEGSGKGRHDPRLDLDDRMQYKPMRCKDCHGTGFACWPLVEPYRHAQIAGPGKPLKQYVIACTWTRGFVSGIECTLEVFDVAAKAGLFRMQPVTRCVLTGRNPEHITPGSPRRCWHRGDNLTHRMADIPDELFYAIPKESRTGNYSFHDTAELALDALSRACVAYGRKLAGLPVLNRDVVLPSPGNKEK